MGALSVTEAAPDVDGRPRAGGMGWGPIRRPIRGQGPHAPPYGRHRMGEVMG